MEDGWVVDYRRTSPAHHQSTAVHMLHLHFDGSTAAYWEGGGGGGNKEKGREAVRIKSGSQASLTADLKTWRLSKLWMGLKLLRRYSTDFTWSCCSVWTAVVHVALPQLWIKHRQHWQHTLQCSLTTDHVPAPTVTSATDLS
ncbi:hypothetical protein EYF80_001405 [Liparis tanakae]|uniref:Uncharacterized protein n=1 Tax=Liparis tanakae TaxID=230148 RepID=A0A4Z2JD79_9TELE|nr:hypothetical protein EYF80_001405 [Liparis tanakae]